MKFRNMIIGGSALLLAASSQAGVIAFDDFATDGAVVGTSGGSGFSDAWSGTGTYVATDGVITGSGDMFRTLSTTWGTSGTIWVSFDFGVDTEQGNYGGLTFNRGTSNRLLLGDSWNKDVWCANGQAVSDNSTISTLGYKTGVAKIVIGSGYAGTCDLWVGVAGTPVDVSGAADASTACDVSGVTGVRYGGGLVENLGDLVLGDTATDVGAIPEPATMGLVAVFGGGLLFVRRFLRI